MVKHTFLFLQSKLSVSIAFLLISGLLSTQASAVPSFDAGGLSYEILPADPPEVTVIGQTGALTSISIPKTVDNGEITYSVTTIEDDAFACEPCDDPITSLTLPEGLQSIGGSAFFGNDIDSLIIPESVTSIANFAFENNGMTTLTVGSSTVEIGYFAFGDNTLTSVKFLGEVTEDFDERIFRENTTLSTYQYCSDFATSWAGKVFETGITGVSTNDICDSDSDGVLNGDDAFPDDDTETTDTDSDGVGDNADEFPNAVTYVANDPVNVTTTPGDSQSDGDISDLIVADFTVPDGFVGIDKQVSFRITDLSTASAETLQVTIDFGEELPEGGVVFKSASDILTVIPNAVIDGTTVTYSITDNGALDSNSELGIIDDPVVVLVPPVLNATPVPVNSLWLLGVLAGLLAMFGFRQLSAA